MAQQMQDRRNRQASPARWQKAAERAVAEGIQIRQLAGTGQWVATSGSDAATAYEVEVTGNVAHGCGCLAGLNDDPVCKHRAAFYLLIGAFDPEPDPPAAPSNVVCFRCRGADAGCPVCAGAGLASRPAQAAAFVAAAEAAEGRMAAASEPQPAPFDAAPDPEPEPEPEPEYVGRAGHVAGYDVLTAGDCLLVRHAATGAELRHVVPNFGTALATLAEAPGLRLGWARFPDDVEALYLHDAEDGNFGYALNLADPALSEWGYAPFVGEESSTCDDCGGPLDADAGTDAALLTRCGMCAERVREAARAALLHAISADHRRYAEERRLAA